MLRRGEIDHPFYRPLWRRIAMVAVILFWVVFEFFFSKDVIWLYLSLALLAYTVWTFLIRYPTDKGRNPTDESGSKD